MRGIKEDKVVLVPHQFSQKKQISVRHRNDLMPAEIALRGPGAAYRIQLRKVTPKADQTVHRIIVKST